jgi:hypothetical protein
MERKRMSRSVMMALLLGVMLLFAACSNAARVDDYHVVYRYEFPTVSNAQYVPGSTITLTWRVIATNDTTPSAYAMTLSSVLSKGQMGGGGVLDRATITTNNWSGKDFTMAVHVPKGTVPGTFYLTQSRNTKATKAFETTDSVGTFITVLA